MSTIDASAVFEAIARRSSPDQPGDLRDALLEIWGSVAEDLTPEEGVVALWCISPQSFAVGSTGHRAQRLAVARAIYPEQEPRRAVSRLRSVMRRASVRAVVDAIRAEDALYALASRDRIRAMLWEIAAERPPVEYEPKDVAAHNRNRLAALKDLVALDRLADPPPERPALEEKDAPRKKVLTRLAALCQRE